MGLPEDIARFGAGSSSRLDARPGRPARELPRVLEQVAERPPEELPIAGYEEPLGEDHLHLPVGIAPPQLVDDVPRDGREIDARGPELGARDARQLEHVVDERAHPLGG
jgi:hypothetical protein